MELYIGGMGQGQKELAAREHPGKVLLPDFHEQIREVLRNGEDAEAFARKTLEEYPDAVIVMNEVGSGIVPLDADERRLREAVGRAGCILAEHAKNVTRVFCGIGVRIK